MMYPDCDASVQVAVFDIRPSTEAEVETIVGDLRKPEDVNKACQGALPKGL